MGFPLGINRYVYVIPKWATCHRQNQLQKCVKETGLEAYRTQPQPPWSGKITMILAALSRPMISVGLLSLLFSLGLLFWGRCPKLPDYVTGSLGYSVV